jgi:nucleoid DNA-binding protein
MGHLMNTLDLMEALQNETGIKNSEAEAVVNLFFKEMLITLAKEIRC